MNTPLRLIKAGNETVLPFVVHGKNRPSSLLEWNRRVYQFFDIPMNYLEFPFPNCRHGQAIDSVLAATSNAKVQPDYFLISEIDSVILRRDAIFELLAKVKDKQTIAGGLHQSNHLKKADGTTNRPYVSPSFHLISSRLYDALGKPTYDHTADCDCAENVTKIAQEKGYCIAGIWPRNIQEPMFALGNGLKFGFGTTYGDYYYHQMCSYHPRHEECFVAKCQEIILSSPETP